MTKEQLEDTIKAVVATAAALEKLISSINDDIDKYNECNSIPLQKCPIRIVNNDDWSQGW